MPGLLNAEDEKAYVDLIQDFDKYYRESRTELMDRTSDWWDLFLAQHPDLRDPIDEMWRSDVTVPLPFSITRTKAAQMVELLGNTEPVWQVEAIRESGNWYEKSKQIQHLLEYTHRMNAWRKFLYKLCTARSVQGTAFMKVVWTKRAHTITLFSSQEAEAKFMASIQVAVSNGAASPPDWKMEPELFDKWAQLVNKGAEQLPQRGMILARPTSGPREIIEYEGPVFQYIPIWSIGLDPLVDEIRDQKVIIHTMYKPLKYVMERADADPNSPMPYNAAAVEEASEGWDGETLEKEQRELAQAMNLNPQTQSHPYLKEGVKLQEVWSPEEPYKYSIIMNEKRVINKRPFERPLLTMVPNIFALRNVLVPGHFYGLSDYQEPEKLFNELNSFRRIRMDGAVLSTLPVFVKAAGTMFTEAMKKIKPGMVITLPKADQIKSLIQHTLPAEAYREPAEIKYEIADATEVYDSTKGAPAQIGRVTGTEYQGRAGQTLLKYKVDASIVEEELLMLPPVILSFFAQMGADRILKTVGGDPDMLVDVSREELIEALGMRYRFRGATKNIQPDLQVQQLTQAFNNMKDVLTPQEKRFGLQLILELLDIRGYSKVLSMDGAMAISGAAGLATGAQNAQNATAINQNEAANVPVPGSIPANEAGALAGGGGGGAQ